MNKELIQEFIEFVRENYNVHFIVEEKDVNIFQKYFPDLVKGEDYETIDNCAERFTNESR